MRVKHDSAAVRFECPGCLETHRIPTDRWQWNGDVDRPTLTPSIKVTSGHYISGWKPGDGCWCGKGYGYECSVCHSFVREGKIEFLSDCTHALAGKTVDLADIED